MNQTWPWLLLLSLPLAACDLTRGTNLGYQDGGADSGSVGGGLGGGGGTAGGAGGGGGNSDGGCGLAPGPVKVVLVLDQSGSMCVSDGPGSQGAGQGFCEQVSSLVVPPGTTEPARIRAIKQLINSLSVLPNVTVSLVPFDTAVKNPWPQTVGTGTRFGAANDPGLINSVNLLQTQLGKGTDYQGALSYVELAIAADVQAMKNTTPQWVGRTRYVVIFISDGTPFPRCAANDALASYADPSAPSGIWADSLGAGTFCNEIPDAGGGEVIPGFVPGSDRNQNYQVLTPVDGIRNLVQTQGVRDVQLHTVLLLNQAAVTACGAICDDLYGTYPNTVPGQSTQAALTVSRWTLQQMAIHGGGTYTERLDAAIPGLSLTGIDLAGTTCP